MRKYKIKYSDEAKKDVRNIFSFIEAISSEENAKITVTRFIKKIRSFTVFPERNEIIGKDKNGLLMRATVSGKYRIIYAVKKNDEEVLVVRIISVSQDFKTKI